MCLSLQNLVHILSDGTYHLEVGKDRVGVVTSDASTGIAGDTVIEVPMRSPAVTVTIRQADDGSPVRSQDVAFWDATEDVVAYDLDSGHHIDAWADALH